MENFIEGSHLRTILNSILGCVRHGNIEQALILANQVGVDLTDASDQYEIIKIFKNSFNNNQEGFSQEEPLPVAA